MTKEVEEINFGIEFLSKVIEWIEANLKPENVFDYGVLEGWALDNGFEEQQSKP